MNEKYVKNMILEALLDQFGVVGSSFADEGVLSSDEGLVIKFDEGQEFQVTIVQSK